jgi:peptide/nickel transport system substrate-binding protein
MSLRQKINNNLLGALLVLGLTATGAMAQGFSDTPALAEMVKSGGLPPVAERLPAQPRVVEGETIGQYGGDLRISMARAKDTRMMTVYGYARLVGFDQSYNLVSDILESFDVEDARIFTLRLRKGHKWSDGAPFTTDDFRYWWEDVANNTDLAPLGPPIFMKVDGELPTVEIIDDVTIRYTWSKPNPSFLPLLAGPRPPFIYRPAHYMKQFHAKYADQAALDAAIKKRRMRSWAALHNASDNMYNFDNPQLPTLQPWFNTVRPPQQQFIFERNPYFHRVDSKGQQLPYIDRVLMNIADAKLIPAKAAAGEADLQARNIFMSHYTFLKRAEEKKKFKTLLWNTALGSKIALYPNMHHKDPVWRGLFRDVRFRRALSLATDRDEINQVIYFGLAQPANNTVLPESPLFRDELQTAWAEFDPDKAEALLDEIGLDKRDDDGVRLLPDGRRLEIVIETAGEETEQVDVLELLHDTWLDVGIKIFTRPSQREVFRNRIFAGDTMMAVWFGVDNGIVSADMSPGEFAPTRQIQYQWPKWGQYFETGGKAGEEIDMPAPKELFDLFRQWRVARGTDERAKIWQRILDIHADQVFTIGIVCCTKQPVVVNNRLKNVPREGVYAWNPGAFFGVYLPDTFYFADAAQ